MSSERNELIGEIKEIFHVQRVHFTTVSSPYIKNPW